MISTTHDVTYDAERDEYRCVLGDGHTVVIAKTLAEMKKSLAVVDKYLEGAAHGVVRN